MSLPPGTPHAGAEAAAAAAPSSAEKRGATMSVAPPSIVVNHGRAYQVVRPSPASLPRDTAKPGRVTGKDARPRGIAEAAGDDFGEEVAVVDGDAEVAGAVQARFFQAGPVGEDA